MSRDTDFSSELLHIEVEGVLFSIPKRIFNDSAVFSDMYQLPQNPNHPVDGVDMAHPLKLDGIKKLDFQNFLRLFISAGQTSLIRAPSLSKDAWVSVLHLTDLWQMPHARDDAITALSELVVDPAEKIVISDRYRITAWTEPALVQLVDRDQPLSVADIERIGISRAANVAARREQILIRPRGFTYNVRCKCDDEKSWNSYQRHTHSSCTRCGTRCLQAALCRKCQTMRCSTCQIEVNVVENEVKASRSTVGWVYDTLKASAFPIGQSVLAFADARLGRK